MYFHNKPDERGSHIKYFVKEDGFGEVFEAYCTVNKKNTLRGLHCNLNQTKIIQVLTGSIRLVILDEKGVLESYIVDNTYHPFVIRPKTWVGYLALEKNTVVNYLTNDKYIPENDLAMNPLSLNNYEAIWQIEKDDIKKLIISERDRNGSLYKDFIKNVKKETLIITTFKK